MRLRVPALFLSVLFSIQVFATRTYNRYALVLEDAPVSAVSGRGVSLEAEAQRSSIGLAQAHLRAELESRKIGVTGSVQTLVNAIFVQATPDRLPELRSLPGVIRVELMPRVHRNLDRAVQLVNAPAAWNLLGGIPNAGLGVKIGIVDTGIDQTHPAFQDALPALAGYPVCQAADCAFTNSKVIVARSYIKQLSAGTQPDPAQDSRPDDNSPRDRVGHGTAVAMIAAGYTNSGPAATITGMAPKAYLGSYKVFGSPGVNDFTSGDVLIQALEDAYNDGMNIVSLSLGSPALSGPLDRGSVCGADPGTACDLEAQAAETAISKGMSVIASAGNEGDTGNRLPTLATIDSPGYSPNVIAVGATTNSHTFVNSVRINGSGVPSNLQRINAALGDGPLPNGVLTAPLRDAVSVGNADACSALPANSLSGAIALVLRGNCNFSAKVAILQTAGAVGVIFIDQAGAGSLTPPGGLSGTTIPSVLIGNSDGAALRSYASSHSGATASLDPGLAEVDIQPFNTVADFSSRGPATGATGIKPDLVAVGTDLYLAAERFDPQGEPYSPDGYTVSQGTSFSAPMVAGAAALVKQKNPSFNAAQVKSALVNTASSDVTDNGSAARVNAVGAGKLDTLAAITANVSVAPTSVLFGPLKSGGSPANRQLQITNGGSSAVNLSLTITRRDNDSNGRIGIDRPNLALAPGQTGAVTVMLSGSLPSPGSYEGAINIAGGATPLHVPFLYLVGDGVPYGIIPLVGDGDDGTVNQDTAEGFVALKLIDRYGVPVSGAAVRFRASNGATVKNADANTDVNGIGSAEAVLGPTPGGYVFTGQAGGLSVQFTDTARLQPTPASNGVVNAASFQQGSGIAPGSYISIFGTGLSDDSNAASTSPLPLSLDGVSVSFDVPSAGLSVPGRLYYVSPGQVNVEVPWELQGQSSVQIKVSVSDSSGQVVTVPVVNAAPALFAEVDANGALLSAGNPARRGQTIVLYANGLGPVSNQPGTGDPAPSSPPSQTTSLPAVTIGGAPASVQFSGLAPNFSGLYQINVLVPANAPTGVQPIVVTMNGTASPAVRVPVQ